MIANPSVVYEQTVCSVGKSGSSVQLWNNIQIGFNPALCGLVVREVVRIGYISIAILFL